MTHRVQVQVPLRCAGRFGPALGELDPAVGRLLSPSYAGAPAGGIEGGGDGGGDHDPTTDFVVETGPETSLQELVVAVSRLWTDSCSLHAAHGDSSDESPGAPRSLVLELATRDIVVPVRPRGPELPHHLTETAHDLRRLRFL